jgi:hypothetical protein
MPKSSSKRSRKVAMEKRSEKKVMLWVVVFGLVYGVARIGIYTHYQHITVEQYFKQGWPFMVSLAILCGGFVLIRWIRNRPSNESEIK